MGRLTAAVRVTDEVWIATALLHREHPRRADFTLQEIETRVTREGITGETRPGVRVHISTHSVANRPADTGRYRMLFETGKSRRRLFRPGDPYDPTREGGQMLPQRDAIPKRYHELLDWYENTWARARDEDPLIALAARHRDIWRGVDADGYVTALRRDFE